MSITSRRSPKLREGLALAIATIFVTLLTLEGVARLAGLVPARKPIIHDATLGWRWNPGYAATATSGEGYEYILYISEQGLRDRSYEIPKPPGATRILMLGDSTTAGQGVDLERSFVRRLESKLIEGFPTIQLINGGTSAYGTEQELLWLQEYGMRFEPDLVVLAYVMNDPAPFDAPPAPFIGFYNLLQEHSAAYGWYLNNRIEREAERELNSPDGIYRDMDNYASFDWKDDPAALVELFGQAAGNWSVSWQPELLEANLDSLDSLQAYVEAQGIPLMIVIVPPHPQVAAHNVPPDFDMDRPQRVLSAWAANQGIPVIDLLPAFRAHPTDDLFLDHVHLSEEGHALVADILDTQLMEGYLAVDPEVKLSDDDIEGRQVTGG